MKISIFNTAKGYIKEHFLVIISFSLFVLIFSGVFILYDLEREALVYALSLLLAYLLVFMPVHFIYYYRRHSTLLRQMKNTEHVLDQLVLPKGLIARDYAEMANNLRELLYQKQSELTRYKRDSEDYYTVWAHQIKTPISVMRLILQRRDSEENDQLLTELFYIEQYVEMVLHYFRLDRSASDFVIKEYALDSIIRQAIRKYAPIIVQKRLKLIYSGTNAKAVTDEKWLAFIIEQLLSNAVKYTQKGSVKIVAEDNTITVSDTGIGIKAEDLPRIFEKGFTGYNGRAEKKSTGLGLYLCKKTADKISAAISASSHVGEGSVFKIKLLKAQIETE